jgi:hypothetical protein
MAIVYLIGWTADLKKVQAPIAIRDRTDLGLKKSKAITDALLSGEVVGIRIDHGTGAEELAACLRDAGVVVEVSGDRLEHPPTFAGGPSFADRWAVGAEHADEVRRDGDDIVLIFDVGSDNS